MPPRRSNRRRRVSIRKPRVLPKVTAPSAANIAEDRSAWRMVKSIRGNNDKYIQQTVGSSTGVIASVPYFLCLNAVGQGTTENTRVGRLLKFKWLDLSFTAEFLTTLDAGTGIGASTVRFYVIVDCSAEGNNFTPGAFFLDASNYYPISQRDRTNRNASRYMVLYDSNIIVLGAAYNGTASNSAPGQGLPCLAARNIHIPLNFSADFSRGNAGTYADIDNNQLWLVAVTDNTVANQVKVLSTFTLAFSDN